MPSIPKYSLFEKLYRLDNKIVKEAYIVGVIWDNNEFRYLLSNSINTLWITNIANLGYRFIPESQLIWKRSIEEAIQSHNDNLRQHYELNRITQEEFKKMKKFDT